MTESNEGLTPVDNPAVFNRKLGQKHVYYVEIQIIKQSKMESYLSTIIGSGGFRPALAGTRPWFSIPVFPVK
ncbi:MAG: hypothetical protein LW707_10945, partial [Sphingobacteriales bacterium]|nr:hypothetical protein [Sphingobacteriales bacterium]